MRGFISSRTPQTCRAAMSIAFSGVGVGSIVLFPAMQAVIAAAGWRTACTALGAVVLVLLAPLNLLVRRRPQDMGLAPDGDPQPAVAAGTGLAIVDGDRIVIRQGPGRGIAADSRPDHRNPHFFPLHRTWKDTAGRSRGCPVTRRPRHPSARHP